LHIIIIIIIISVILLTSIYTCIFKDAICHCAHATWKLK
jgi:hypothetical protein